jgi:hypothetical protein
VLEESSATRLGSVSNAILIEVQARVAAHLGLDDRA